jgi:hypothetical protein
MTTAGRVNFSYLIWSKSLLAWIMETRTGDDHNAAPVSSLVGKTVNIGDKDGGVWDAVTVTAFDETRGFLTLEGGRYGSAFRSAEEARPLEGLHSLSAYDVARGYIHGDEEAPQ